MKEAYVSFETAKLLKEKGFDWGCCSYWCVFPNGDIVHTDYGHFANYNGNETDRFVSRPTQALAHRWLREEKGIHIYLIPVTGFKYVASIYTEQGNKRYDKILLRTGRHAYEDAIEAALEYVLKNLI